MADTYSGEFYCVKCKEKRQAEGQVDRRSEPPGPNMLRCVGVHVRPLGNRPIHPKCPTESARAPVAPGLWTTRRAGVRAGRRLRLSYCGPRVLTRGTGRRRVRGLARRQGEHTSATCGRRTSTPSSHRS